MGDSGGGACNRDLWQSLAYREAEVKLQRHMYRTCVYSYMYPGAKVRVITRNYGGITHTSRVFSRVITVNANFMRELLSLKKC